MLLNPLLPGDIVEVIAPASKCSLQELRNGLATLKSLGLRPRVPTNLFAKSLLFSNHDRARLQHLRKALYAPDSKMIWCVRGGYGALRLMPEIEKWSAPKLRKIFLGYSDITTLHVHLNQKWKWHTLHGPMVGALGRDALKPSERKELLNLIFGRQDAVTFRALRPLNAAARQARIVRAPLFGGNMAVLQSALGTPSALRPGKHILFFEDTGERPHRVDRMLEQFTQAGWFKNCQAIVLGDFLLKEARDRRGLWQDVFPRFAANCKVPVLAGLAVGHQPGKQRTLPLNTPAQLHLGAKPQLLVSSGIAHEPL